MTSSGGSVQAADTEVLSAARDWLAKGQRVALVTVLRTWGSSPRPPGSLLAIGIGGAGGALAGSVSGGCVEQELADRYRKRELGTSFPTLVDFRVDNREASRLGLPCGGRLELLVEELEAPEPVTALLSRLKRGALVARRVCLRTAEVSLHGGEERPELEVTPDAVTKVFGPG